MPSGASMTTDDLAFEAIEIMKRKNMSFTVKTAGRSWSCKLTPREEYEKSRNNSSSSTATLASTKSEEASHSGH